jgi:hypothetical protein
MEAPLPLFTYLQRIEHVLSGIDLVEGTLQQVRSRFGAPTEMKEGVYPQDPPGSGYALYRWQLRNAILTVDTDFYHDEGGRRVETLVAATLTGARPDHRLGTSRGLRLGDTWARARRLYGRRFVNGTVNGPKVGPRTVTFCFSDETELEIGLGPGERVVSLRLAPSQE